MFVSVNEAQEHIAVVNRGSRHLIIGDDFALSIDFGMVFVAIMKFLVFDGPTGINILLRQVVLSPGVSASHSSGILPSLIV